MKDASSQFTYADAADSVYDQLAEAGNPDTELTEESGQDALLAMMLAHVDQDRNTRPLPIQMYLNGPEQVIFALAIALLLERYTLKLQRGINHEKGEHLITLLAVRES